MDTLAEWLRRRPAKPMGSPRVGSNPTGVALPLAGCRLQPRRSDFGLLSRNAFRIRVLVRQRSLEGACAVCSFFPPRGGEEGRREGAHL